ncbi:hypothetical protein Tco_1045820 [Tanacetum coccineum]|uniref:Uncharacterized protein n=1 Tax=Tanacetum coccineum TaxID=301880 RepID=A0ABQ5GVG0_9ASTR
MAALTANPNAPNGLEMSKQTPLRGSPGSGSDEMGDEDDDDGGVGLMMVAWCCCGAWRGMMTGDSGCWPDMVVWMIMTMSLEWWSRGGCDGDVGGVMVAAVGRQPEEVEARGGEWYSGSGRSGLDLSLLYHFCGSPENSPERFSGGGWPEKVAAGRREGWPDIWRRREDL